MNDSASKIYKNLREILLEKGLINQEKVKEIELRQLKTGETEEEVVRVLRLVPDVDLIKAKADFLRVPFVDLETIGFSPEALTLVPESVARKYKIVPYNLDTKNKILSVAMVNPLDLETIEFLEKKTGLKVGVAIALESQITSFVKEKYIREKNITSEVTKALDERKDEEKVMKLAEEKVAVEAPVSKIVTTILEYAVKSRASDVHIEPQEDSVRIRYRIDGILQEKYLLPRNVHEAVISRIKILAGLKIDEKRIPQEGRFFFTRYKKLFGGS